VDDQKRESITDERWQCITREQIAKKNDSLDLGLIADSSLSNGEDLDDPIDIAKEAVLELKSIIGELDAIIKELS
jgi:type I restriction enzyme M protein